MREKKRKRKRKQTEGKKEACVQEAYRILSIRPYSVKEVVHKLTLKGFQEKQIKDTVNKLEGLGYLDDLALARNLIDIKFRLNGYGRWRVRAYLLRRKLPSNLIEEEVAKMISYDDSVSMGVSLLSRKKKMNSPFSPKEKGNLLRYLAARGFDLRESRDIISEYECMTEIEK